MGNIHNISAIAGKWNEGTVGQYKLNTGLFKSQKPDVTLLHVRNQM